MHQGNTDDMSTLWMDEVRLNTVVFDFDGTLARLNIDFHLMRQAILKLIGRWGITPGNPDVSYVLEMIHESETLLSSQSLHDARAFSSEAFRIIESIEIRAAENGELFEWTRELFIGLHAANIHTGIITRNCTKAVFTVFPDIANHCDVVICRDDIERVKPHPDHLNRALIQLGSRPCDTLMVGDHPLDVEAGRTSGAWSAGVLTGRHSREDFIRSGAHWVLNRASDLLETIRP
jgi:phosphoglycolate phosphatase